LPYLFLKRKKDWKGRKIKEENGEVDKIKIRDKESRKESV
jgi:hypothetical protein